MIFVDDFRDANEIHFFSVCSGIHSFFSLSSEMGFS